MLTKNAALIAEGATFKQAAAHFKTKQEEALATAALRQVELKDMELENKWLRYKLYGGHDYVAYVYKLPLRSHTDCAGTRGPHNNCTDAPGLSVGKKCTNMKRGCSVHHEF